MKGFFNLLYLQEIQDLKNNQFKSIKLKAQNKS